MVVTCDTLTCVSPFKCNDTSRSSSATTVMVSKLTFKSDKSTKKRKRHVDADSKQDGQQDQDRRQDQESQDQPNEWVDAEMTCDLNGPCMFLVVRLSPMSIKTLLTHTI